MKQIFAEYCPTTLIAKDIAKSWSVMHNHRSIVNTRVCTCTKYTSDTLRITAQSSARTKQITMSLYIISIRESLFQKFTHTSFNFRAYSTSVKIYRINLDTSQLG